MTSQSDTGKPRVFLTVRELAEELNVCVETIRRWIRAGKLQAVEIGHYRISPEDAAAALAANKKRQRR